MGSLEEGSLWQESAERLQGSLLVAYAGVDHVDQEGLGPLFVGRFVVGNGLWPLQKPDCNKDLDCFSVPIIPAWVGAAFCVAAQKEAISEKARSTKTPRMAVEATVQRELAKQDNAARVILALQPPKAWGSVSSVSSCVCAVCGANALESSCLKKRSARMVMTTIATALWTMVAVFVKWVRREAVITAPKEPCCADCVETAYGPLEQTKRGGIAREKSCPKRAMRWRRQRLQRADQRQLLRVPPRRAAAMLSHKHIRMRKDRNDRVFL